MRSGRASWCVFLIAACGGGSSAGPDGGGADLTAPDGPPDIVPEAGTVDAGSDTLATVWPPPTTYKPTSPMLLDPETSGRAMAVSCADFWKKARDTVNGGFYTYVNRQGAVATNRGKSFECQSRLGIVFAHTFMLTGDESYLEAGRAALDFLYAHGWDQTNGGWYFTGDEKGSVLAGTDNSNKWSFVQHYNIFGPLAMCEATNDPVDCGWADKGRATLDKMWDPDATTFGYYDYATSSFGSFTGKGFTPTVDGLGTNALLSYLLSGSATHRQRILALADNVLTHLVASMDRPDVKFGFAEFYDADWSVETTKTGGFTGHVFKTAWQLARVYLMNPDDRYRAAARRLLHAMWDQGGFDRTNGAPNGTFDWDSGLNLTTKNYWEVEQGFTAGITSFFIEDSAAERELDLEIADRSVGFLQKYFMDAQYGGMYFTTSADGTTVTSSAKSDKYESGHHCVETGYYGYLYGNLLYRRQPVTLHYRFAPATTERKIRLSPLTLEDSRLQISAVELAGAPFTGFDRQTRTVTVPASVGGVFKVTFQPVY